MATVGSDRLALLADLLHALRHRGVAIGPRELDRLRTVFERKPSLGYRELRALLRSVLVKHPRERDIFEPLFDAWCPDQDADWPEPAPAPTATGDSPESPARQSAPVRGPEKDQTPWWRSRTVSLIVGVGGLILTAAILWPRGVVIDRGMELGDPTSSAAPPRVAPGELPSQPVPEVWYWQASIDRANVTTRVLASPLRLSLLGLTALGLAAFLLGRHRLRFPNLKPKKRDRAGPGWQPLPEPALGPLIPRADRQRALWQIERFVSEDITPRLDIPRTVRDTAQAAGFARVHYQAAAYERGVRFWWDRQLEVPTIRAAAAELAATLRAGGIDFGEGFFFDVPDRIDGTHGRAFRPINEEGAGREAVVAVFIDGVGLQGQLEHPLRGRAVNRLLRDLTHWPRLCFVDCSANGRVLADLFRSKRLRLKTIRPDSLSTWLGGEFDGISPAEKMGGINRDEWLLASSLALGGTPIRRADAFRLRDELGLTVDTWRIEHLARELNRQPEGIPIQINRLLRCEPLPGDGLPRQHSVAHRAVSWWWERYRVADLAEGRGENRLLPWRDSIPQQEWALEAALLRLYIEPQLATKDLRRIADADQQTLQDIRNRLHRYCAEDDPRPGNETEHLIRFTWHFGELPLETKHTLLALGFEIATARSLTPIPPLLALGTGSLGGLGVASLAAAGWFLLFPATPLLLHTEPHTDPRLEQQTLRVVEAVPYTDGFRVVVGSARAPLIPVTANPGTKAPVSWTWQKADNGRPVGNSVLLRAGTLAQPIRGCGGNWPARSLVVMATNRDGLAARQLAIRLLDLGSADQVLIGSDWADHLDTWLGPSTDLNRQTQLLIVARPGGISDDNQARLRGLDTVWALYTTSDIAAVARALMNNPELRGEHRLQDIERRTVPWERQGGVGSVYLYGGPVLSTDDKGIEWAYLCPGTYTPGVASTLVLSGFWIATTEITESQYTNLVSDSERNQAGQLPVVEVNWDEAQEACRGAGGILPTEAQWEYAARGGSRTAWSFGDNEADLVRYAWYDRNANRPQPVRGRLPNPLGLYDMHGNVWEWTRDYYANYPVQEEAGEVFLDPRGPLSARRRVVRGGSFGNPPERLRSASRIDFFPEGLRSARRGGVGPVLRVEGVGFRCVRVPPQR